ncbi:MAG TPA: HAD family phosphatase [Patescibacteria group bacterium]|nr:HAD family phosphatase [Patescibacteria group bacterium]
MIKAVIFDWFGVIVGQGFDHTYRLAGGDPEKDKSFTIQTLKLANFGQISTSEFNKKMAEQLNISLETWHQAVLDSELADFELLNYIKSLKGKYKTAILSNANRGALTNKLAPHQLEEYFDELIVSAEVGMAKPDREIYHLAANKLNVAVDECLFIDDSQTNVEIAQSVGMHAILYDGFNKLKKELTKILV